VEWAAASLRHACWAQGYDQPQREQGQAPQAAVRALAFPWHHSLSRGWKERPLSDASTSLQALPRRGSSLLHNLAQAA